MIGDRIDVADDWDLGECKMPEFGTFDIDNLPGVGIRPRGPSVSRGFIRGVSNSLSSLERGGGICPL